MPVKTTKQQMAPQRGGERLTQAQREQLDRFIERALGCLDNDDIQGFWDRLDIANAYMRRVKNE